MSTQAHDPRTGQAVGAVYQDTDQAQLQSLLADARAAYPHWSGLSRARRADVLDQIAIGLDTATPMLAQIADTETALGQTRLRGEIERTSAQLRLFARIVRVGGYLEAILDSADPSATPPRPDLRRMLQPLGPVAVFGASNFPFAYSIIGGDSASALAAGCPVIAKAHPAQPGTAAATAAVVHDALRATAVDAGVFAVVYGQEAGLSLVDHPSIRAVGFTGSTSGGRYLFDLAQRRPDPIPFYGELGSVNPVVILPHAAQRRAVNIARDYAASLTLSVGQLCTNPGILIAPHALLTALAEAVSISSGGPMLTAAIQQAYQSGTQALAEIAQHLATGQAGSGEVSPQLYAVSSQRFLANPAPYLHEHFGPAGLVLSFEDPNELEAIVAALPGALTSTLHAEEDDHPLVTKLLPMLNRLAGRIIWNGWPTGVTVTHATHHGGPWPASTNPLHTSVGATAIRRWLTPLCYQNYPQSLLPEELRDGNPCAIPRFRDGKAEIPSSA